MASFKQFFCSRTIENQVSFSEINFTSYYATGLFSAFDKEMYQSQNNATLTLTVTDSVFLFVQANFDQIAVSLSDLVK